MRSIVVGFDGSAGARDALGLAAELARLLDCRLVLACVERSDADTILASADVDGGLEVERVAVHARSASHGLIDVAGEQRADLLVVGASRYAPVGLVVPGSVGSELVDAAPCPVAFAPRGYRPSRPRQLAVAVDEARADGLAARATNLATALGATVSVMPFGAAEHGRAAARITAQCERGVDLLIMSSAGYGARTVQLAGVPARVLDAAPCPILIVPRDADKEAEHGIR